MDSLLHNIAPRLLHTLRNGFFNVRGKDRCLVKKRISQVVKLVGYSRDGYLH